MSATNSKPSKLAKNIKRWLATKAQDRSKMLIYFESIAIKREAKQRLNVIWVQEEHKIKYSHVKRSYFQICVMFALLQQHVKYCYPRYYSLFPPCIAEQWDHRFVLGVAVPPLSCVGKTTESEWWWRGVPTLIHGHNTREWILVPLLPRPSVIATPESETWLTAVPTLIYGHNIGDIIMVVWCPVAHP